MDINQALAILTQHIQKEEQDMPRPLQYGQGSIVKRTKERLNGTCRIWYEAKFVDETGTRRSRTFTTKQKAYEFLIKPRKTKKKKPVRIKSIAFGDYLRDWYKIHKEPNLTDRNNRKLQAIINKIPTTIMQKALNTISANELQSYLNTIASSSTKSVTKDIFKACLRYAMAEGKIKHDIGFLLKAQVPKPRERNILPRSLEQKFIEAFPDKLKGYVIGYIYTGARLQELKRVLPEDIDYSKRIITIKSTKNVKAIDRNSGITYKTRIVPLLPPVAALSFPLPKICTTLIERGFIDASAVIGIKLTPHDMRHTFISRCNELGVSASILRMIAGHTHEDMTRYYTHNTMELTQSEFSKIQENTPPCTPFLY